ncbi:SulP family inorganic anion transporter [Litorivicinus sp.]|nr:SulP family inorganic anion transporter [Litorivicinus sp.]
MTNIRGDTFGGVTAAVVALPMALAFGVASGAGPEAGLYGAVLVGLFAALFGATPTLMSEPTGPMTVVFTAVLASLIATNPDQGLAMAFTVVILAGVFQISFGIFKIGHFVTLMPYTVVSGFMSGIGLILIILQIGPLLGSAPPAGGVIGTLSALPLLLSSIAWTELALGAMTFCVLIYTPKQLRRYLPPQLLALVLGTIVGVFILSGEIRIIGQIPTGLPSMQIPAFDWGHWQTILVNALVLAMLGSIDALLTSVIADSLTKQESNANKELIGQGIGNIASGLFGGLPGAGATMGTVVNIQAGAQTALSGLIRVLVLIIVIIGIADLTAMIPLAVLSGIALSVGLNIIDWGFLKRAHHVSPKSAAIMYAVIGLTVFVDLIIAVSIGVFVANLLTIDRLTKVQSDSVKAIRDGDEEELTRGEQTILNDANGKILVFSLGGPLFFGLAKAISRQRAVLSDHEVLILDFTDVPVIGVSSSLAIEQMVHDDLASAKPVYLVGMVDSVQERMGRLGVLEHIPVHHIFTDRQSCLEDASVYLKQKADS